LSTFSLPSLAEESKGLFVKEIEQALLDGSIDLAVHSLKDVPTDLPDGLCLASTPLREEPWDALISNHPLTSLKDLPEGARIGTGSLRRQIQLGFQRPDLQIEPIRGNIDTRIRKLRENQFDAVVLAAAGLRRLNVEQQISYRFSAEEIVPAVGQGCLALEVREKDTAVREIVERLNHRATNDCVFAERAFLKAMGSGCQLPLGAYAVIEQGQSKLFAFLSSPSGSQIIKQAFWGAASELNNMVGNAIREFRAQGSERILGDREQ
jgi:hydroxymethylbilane synthase